MKAKILSLIICCLTAVSLFSCVTFADNSDTVNKAQSLIDGIIGYKLNEASSSDVQEWIDTALTENAGISSEWYIIALKQNGSYDFSEYSAALNQYLDEKVVHSASSRLKYALAFAAADSDNGYITATLDSSTGQQGVMSWIFSLHLMNNGYESGVYPLSDVLEALLSLQLTDGGWAVMGENGDIDVTAMAIQALAPYYRKESKITAAIDKALAFLSDKQLSSGAFRSIQGVTAESIAQVIVALSSLGINCNTDERFIKNDITLFDALEKFRLDDGSFCHEEGGNFNDTATVQVFYSLVSYIRMTNGKSGLFIFDDKDQMPVPDNSSQSAEEQDENSETNDSKIDLPDAAEQKISYKLWASIAVAVVGAVVCVVLFIAKKRSIRNFITVVVIAVIAIVTVCTTNFQTVDEFYSDSIQKENTIGSVTLTIRCDTVAGKTDNEYIPENGIILDTTEFEISDGDTVYDILSEAAAKYKIHIEGTGGEVSAYIEGINYLYEFDFGDLSGWLYYVNGSQSSTSCSKYELKDNDIIEWHYSCEMGKDIG